MSRTENERTPVNVLVVDDHRENRVALKAILSSPEYRILEADGETEALRHLLREDCAVILLDVIMPGTDGFELASLIKRHSRTAAIPIVFLTAEAVDTSFMRRAYRVGAADYLVKPLLPQMVRSKVAVFAELHRQRQRIEAQARQLVEAERAAAEGRLTELRLAGERRYRHLAEAVPHIIWTARGDGRVDHFNGRWREYVGTEVGTDWMEAVHADDRAAVDEAWTRAISLGAPLEVECRLRAHDGEYRWQLCRGLPELGADGQPLSWAGTFTDIDDQKRVQTVLAEFKGMLDAVPDAVLIFEADSGRTLYVNHGAGALLGYARDELMALTPGEVMPELAADGLRPVLAPLADGCATMECRYRRKDGGEVPVELSLRLVSARGGDRIIAIARDITERKLAEAERDYLYQKALDAVQARDEFLSVASHELRTPLTSLDLQVQSMLRGAGRGTEQIGAPAAGKLDMIARQVRRLTRLLEELLDVSRISSGQFRIEPEELDLAALIQDTLQRLTDDAAKARCEIRLAGAAEVSGLWDRLRLEQVLMNLFTNALKFGVGKPVEVELGADDDTAWLTVRDHGIGIPRDAQQRIFERFERAPSARGYGGLGLGLYIARQIVEAHGGEIEVASTPGQGATFKVKLPRRAAMTDEAESVAAAG